MHKFGFAVFVSLCNMGQTIAGPIFYSASDSAPLTPPLLVGMPNSVAASNAWDLAARALGSIQLINFESSYPSTPQTSLPLAPGVTLSNTVGDFTISADTWFSTMTLNTTPGGSFYAALNPCASGFFCFSSSVYTFSFDSPIEAFGLYITGRGQNVIPPQDLSFNDPLLWSVPLPYSPFLRTTGQFVGFTDSGARISSVSILIGGSSFPIVPDSFAFDDVRFVSVPEPSSLSLVMAVFPTAAYLLLRRKSRGNGALL